MTAQTILPANTLSSGYDVANSLRFNRASEDSIDRTPGSAGNQKKFTFSTWIKRSTVGHGSGPEEFIMYGRPGSNTDTRLYFTGDGNASDDRLYFQSTTDNTTHTALQTNRKFRDISSWYHIVISVNTEDGNGSSSTIQMFINGVKETSFATETYGSQNKLFYWTDDALTTIGRRSENNGQHFHGYVAETVLIDGQALDADSFGEFDSDSPTIWKPKDVSGLTFGTNGFYLEFKQSGTSQNSSGLGADTSGNDNHFAVNNLTAVDQSTDTCTNNFATMNPLDNYFTSSTFSEGNLKIATGGSSLVYNTSTIGFNTGKWYMEVKCSGSVRYVVGVITGGATANNNDNKLGNRSDGWGYDYRGLVENAGADEGGTFATFSSGNIIGIYADLDNNKLYFSKDGTLQNSGTGLNLDVSGSPTYFFAVGDNHASESSTFEVNFGSPSFAISSGNTDGEYGNFEYSTTITGDGASKTFKALNTKNLAEYG